MADQEKKIDIIPNWSDNQNVELTVCQDCGFCGHNGEDCPECGKPTQPIRKATPEESEKFRHFEKLIEPAIESLRKNRENL